MLITSFVCILGPVAASAESMQWNTTETKSWCWPNPLSGNPCYVYTSRPHITITQNVHAVQIDANGNETGVNYACGSTVPAGTNVRFKFDPLSGGDIYWFGTGGVNDSPYGRWDNPDVTPTSICQPADFLWNAPNGSAQYVSLIVRPPVRTVQVAGATCTAGTEEADCSNIQTGTVDATFSVSPTDGKVYFQDSFAGTCDTTYKDKPLTIGDYAHTPYQLKVPAQALNYACSLTVTPGPGTGSIPSKPTVSSGGAQCITGSSFQISFTSTSPDNHPLRYRIDWDGDGIVDEMVPASGYVPSGTTQTASRIFAVDGQKTIQVSAEDDRGLVSAWATLNFSCRPDSRVQSCQTGYVWQDGSCVFTQCPTGYSQLADQCVSDRCPLGYIKQGAQCVFSACPTGYVNSNGSCARSCIDQDVCQGNNIYHQSSQCQLTYLAACPYSCVNGVCMPADDGSVRAVIRAKPSLLEPNETSRVIWASQNADTCSVSGSNGDNWTGLQGSQLSQPIVAATLYTLRCIAANGRSASAQTTVTFLPKYQER